ncbi:hypothetical protein [Halomonas sp. AOP42-E1-30]|uniref:hypothetical protein n=1 Tax=Halomonas sp. AOP42-E1-30 TaxID=3457665 RepID=UPI0040346340
MSELKTLLVNGKGPGGFGTGAFSYMHQLIGERITGELAEPFQGNAHTKRGHKLESVARELYRDATVNQSHRKWALSSITRWATYPTVWCVITGCWKSKPSCPNSRSKYC